MAKERIEDLPLVRGDPSSTAKLMWMIHGARWRKERAEAAAERRRAKEEVAKSKAGKARRAS